MKHYMIYKNEDSIEMKKCTLVEAKSEKEAIDLYIEQKGIYEEEFLNFIYDTTFNNDTLGGLIYDIDNLSLDVIIEYFENMSDVIAIMTYRDNLGYMGDISLFANYKKLISDYFEYIDSVNEGNIQIKYLNEEMLVFAYKYLWNDLGVKQIEVTGKVA